MVLFPAPLGPSNPTMPPRGIVNDTPLTAVCPGYSFLNSTTSTIGFVPSDMRIKFSAAKEMIFVFQKTCKLSDPLCLENAQPISRGSPNNRFSIHRQKLKKMSNGSGNNQIKPDPFAGFLDMHKLRGLQNLIHSFAIDAS